MIIPVKTEQGSYDIVLERGALDKVGELLGLDRRVLVVTDSGVPIKYARSVAKQCKESKLLLIKSGEASKCFRSLEGVLSAMLNFSAFLPVTSAVSGALKKISAAGSTIRQITYGTLIIGKPYISEPASPIISDA